MFSKSLTIKIALLVTSMVSHVTYAANCDNLTGAWVTEKGSTLTLNSDGTSLNGVYSLKKNIDPTPYPVIGFINTKPAKPHYDHAPAVSFVVHWGGLGSVSSWTGVCRNKNGHAILETVGHQVRPVVKQSNEHMHTFMEIFKAVK